jgi:hypothetical protein
LAAEPDKSCQRPGGQLSTPLACSARVVEKCHRWNTKPANHLPLCGGNQGQGKEAGARVEREKRARGWTTANSPGGPLKYPEPGGPSWMPQMYLRAPRNPSSIVSPEQMLTERPYTSNETRPKDTGGSEPVALGPTGAQNRRRQPRRATLKFRGPQYGSDRKPGRRCRRNRTRFRSHGRFQACLRQAGRNAIERICRGIRRGGESSEKSHLGSEFRMSDFRRFPPRGCAPESRSGWFILLEVTLVDRGNPCCRNLPVET